MPRAFPLLLAIALLAACERPGNPDEARAFAARALRGTLAYPQSSVVSVSAGDEAAELVLSSPDSVAAVAAWYRRALPLNGWEVKRDVRDRSGTVTIYAEQGPRPLWVTLRPNVGGAGTTYTMVGAVVPADSTRRGATR
jgi:hypothetical protein